MRVIKRNIGNEELKSRIPGLFPYLEFNEFGELIKHKATDSVDGCFGKIIPDYIGGSTESSGAISYRTLIDRYYSGEDVENIGDYSFEDVIGKFSVNLDDYDKTQTLVPRYVYAAEAKELLDKMIKLKRSCSASAINPIFCCECKEYTERGGDKMVEFLQEISAKAQKIADDIFELFDNDANIRININLNSEIEDFGYYTTAETIGDESTCNEEIHDIGDVDNAWTISGSTDSKLKSLRRYTTYIDDNGVSDTPDNDSDWLYFYRKGYVANYETLNDDLGNISFINDVDTPVIDEDGFVTNLEAYGNVLYDITRDKDERSITFVYYINAHLKAKSAGQVNGQYYYKYPFTYDSGGVMQIETYYYGYDSDIDKLSDEDFEKLISLYTVDSNGKIEQDFGKTKNLRYEFSTLNSGGQYEKTIFDHNVDIAYGKSSFEYVKYPIDVSHSTCYALFKEDYLSGIHYKPSISTTVNIQRGNNSAFERHIRLGEVKTLEDMENYQNGTFFNMQGLYNY